MIVFLLILNQSQTIKLVYLEKKSKAGVKKADGTLTELKRVNK